MRTFIPKFKFLTFNGRKKVLNIKLWEIAHSHTGDKGDISNVSLIAYNAEDFELLKEKVTSAALGGGVTRSLSVNMHGKGLSSYLLNIDI